MASAVAALCEDVFKASHVDDVTVVLRQESGVCDRARNFDDLIVATRNSKNRAMALSAKVEHRPPRHWITNRLCNRALLTWRGRIPIETCMRSERHLGSSLWRASLLLHHGKS